MLRVTIFRSRFLAGGLVAAFLLMVVPFPAASQTPAPSSAQTQARSYARQGTLQGVVYGEGMKQRITGAVVKVRNLNNQKEFSSAVTDARGQYKILGIEEGWYTLGVTTAAGDFNLNYGVYIKAGQTAKLSVELLPGGMLEGKGGNGGGKSFFSTPGGILLIVAMAGGAGFAVYQLTKKEEEASPIR
jgi:hypothetical protein